MMMVILASILTVSIVGLVFSRQSWCIQFSMMMVGMVMLILLMAQGPSWYNILHNDGSDGDVGIVGRLRAFVA